MTNILLFDKKKNIPLRDIPNILEHRMANVRRVSCGKDAIDFWDTVPELLNTVRQYAKKENKTMFELKETVELLLTIAAVKSVEYVY